MPELLKLSNVKLAFSGEVRLRIDELSVGSGEKVLLLGHNGAGKTTLLNVAAGIAHPTGQVSRHASIHIFSHQPMLFSSLTVREHLDFWGPVFQIERQKLSQTASDWGLSKLMNRTPSQLSRGEQARVALVRALASDAEILLLDEPTNALDMAYIRKLEAALSTSSRTIIASSHSITPGIFTRIIVLKNGAIIKDLRDPGSFESVISAHVAE
jgi:ATP-binding cassette subfamily F protein uup